MPRPMVFLSHKHQDQKLADVVRSFIEERTLGQVEVFQSSEFGAGLRIGRVLDDELLDKLFRSEVLILLYTTDQRDWSFCMWECGVALDPETRDTEILVFQCTDDVPDPFEDEIRVDLRKRTDVHRFVTTFFTDATFFPRQARPLTQWNEDSEEIDEIAEEFFDELQKTLASLGLGPTDESVTFSQLTLRLPIEVEEVLRTADLQRARELVLSRAEVQSCDQESAGHFGMPDIREGTPLKQVISTWQRDATHEAGPWVDGLLDQVARAIVGKSPHVCWHVLKGEESQSWFAPTVHKFRRMAGERCFQLDVYFIPFQAGGGSSIEIPLPVEVGDSVALS